MKYFSEMVGMNQELFDKLWKKLPRLIRWAIMLRYAFIWSLPLPIMSKIHLIESRVTPKLEEALAKAYYT